MGPAGPEENIERFAAGGRECRWNYIVLETIFPPNYGENVSSSLVAARASEAQLAARQPSKLKTVGSSPITRF